jgi:hypothetical protein
MRYNYEFFTEINLKDGFIILPYNMNTLCRAMETIALGVEVCMAFLHTTQLHMLYRLHQYEACPKSIRLYFFPEKLVTAGWQI